jgi:hypothetical protein
MRILASVALCVLSSQSGTDEQIAEFCKLAKEKYPKYVLDMPEDETKAVKLVTKTLKRMNAENTAAGEQIHHKLILKFEDTHACFEDAGREETEYYCIVLAPVEDEETFNDELSNLYNCMGAIVRGENETMETFVDTLFKE